MLSQIQVNINLTRQSNLDMVRNIDKFCQMDI